MPVKFNSNLSTMKDLSELSLPREFVDEIIQESINFTYKDMFINDDGLDMINDDIMINIIHGETPSTKVNGWSKQVDVTGESSEYGRFINIYPDAIATPSKTDFAVDLVGTSAHEMRHQYQYFTGAEQIGDQSDYIIDPYEVGARKYEEEIASKYTGDIVKKSKSNYMQKIEKETSKNSEYKNKRKRKREAAAQQAIEDRIKTAQSNPLYKTIHDVIGEADNIEDAQKLLNKFGRDNSIDPSQLKAFLTENQDTFFTANGTRVPFIQNMDNIKFGMNNSNGPSPTPEVETSSSNNTGKNSNTGESNSSKKRKQREAVKQSTQEVVEEVTEQTTREGIEELGESNLKKIFNKRSIGIGLNAFFAISDYKNAREEGKGVIAAAGKSAGLFIAGEALGGAMFPVMLASAAPKAAVSLMEGMQKMTRQMNSVQRIQTFGEAYFQDTNQLATMRQAGMELAKMSQYNLQQSVMGNEAQYMHRY